MKSPTIDSTRCTDLGSARRRAERALALEDRQKANQPEEVVAQDRPDRSRFPHGET